MNMREMLLLLFEGGIPVKTWLAAGRQQGRRDARRFSTVLYFKANAPKCSQVLKHTLRAKAI